MQAKAVSSHGRGIGNMMRMVTLVLLVLCAYYFNDPKAFIVSNSPSLREVELMKEVAILRTAVANLTQNMDAMVALRTTVANVDQNMDNVTKTIIHMNTKLDKLGSSIQMRLDDAPAKQADPSTLGDSSTQGDSSTATSFRELNARLLGPDEYGGGCHPTCGCPKAPQDCPRWYKTPDLLESIARHSEPDVRKEMAEMLKASKQKARDVCSKPENEVQKEVGGWCLKPQAHRLGVKYQNKSFPMAVGHVPASERIVIELEEMIKTENITSINDFGAGIGQYKAAILPKFPTGLTYSAYDGAGNVEDYTQGLVDYFDLTVPLDLPVSDWVISLEVGEHVPSKFEGMVIRNLHRHNRKGIILSWAKLGQDGTAHVNNHSPQYVQSLFRELGYFLDAKLSEKFQQRKGNYPWLSQGTLSVLRRIKAN